MVSKSVVALIKEHNENGTIELYIRELKDRIVKEKLTCGVEQIPTQVELKTAIEIRDGTFKEENVL